MNRREFIKTTGIGLAAFAAGKYGFCAENGVRPNIVWIFPDDHAYQAIGAYGGRLEGEKLTPNIDSLARDGMTFDRCYVANSICMPSRATLLTGKHSHLHGQMTNRNRSAFDHDQQQFQTILQANGYHTALFGKIHLRGKLQGFDHWEVMKDQGKYWHPRLISNKWKGMKAYFGKHSTDVITSHSLAWLQNRQEKDKPFMLMVHYKAPHRNWQPTNRWKEKFKDRTFPEPETLFDDYEGRGTAAREQDMSIAETMRMEKDIKADQPERQAELAGIDPDDKKALIRLKYQWYMRDYLACVAGVDEGVGRLLDYLEESGLAENTIVMYSSDQGFYLGEHGWFDKRFMYEESCRTPLVARWPGVVQPGTRNSDLVQNIDFAPTFLDIAGAPVPGDMQGRSIVPLLKGRTPADWRRSLYYHYYEFPGEHSVRRHEGVIGKRYKLIRFYGGGVPGGEEWEFYDLKTDPGEMKNIYGDAAQQDRIREFKKELQRLRKFYKVPEQ
ncbi:MAG: sulfatase [Verrucomicrobiota bacterium]